MATKITPDLSGVHLKLDRAEKHINEIAREIKAFVEGEPAPFGLRTEEKPGPDNSIEHVLYAVSERNRREIWRCLSVTHSKTCARLWNIWPTSFRRHERERSGQTSFPIFSDECEFKVRGLPRIKSIPTWAEVEASE